METPVELLASANLGIVFRQLQITLSTLFANQTQERQVTRGELQVEPLQLQQAAALMGSKQKPTTNHCVLLEP